MGKKYQNENLGIEESAEVSADIGYEFKNQGIIQNAGDKIPQQSSTKSKVIVTVLSVAESKRSGHKYVKRAERINMKMRSESVIGTCDIIYHAIFTF